MGAIINVVKVSPLNESIEVSIKGSKLAIERDIACNVFVKIED
jgi:DtxR family Mn-dependent transcriptional regulator